MWKTRNSALRSPLYSIFCIIAPSSYCWEPLQRAAAQSVTQKRTRKDSRRSTRFSSSSSSKTDFSIPAPPSANPRATLAQDPAPAQAPAPTDDLFRQFIQAYMEDRCQPAPATAPVEPREDALDRLLKAWNPDLYYSNLNIECYYFYQQCEDHFETSGTKGHKRVPFATTLLKDRIFNRWQQHKARTKCTQADPLS